MHSRSIAPDEFQGTAGRVLMGAISLEALITGAIVVAFLKGAEFGLAQVGHAPHAFLATFVLFSLFLARFAANGAAGEYRGTLLSDEGGDWGVVAKVTARFLLLCALWIIPLEVLGWTPDKFAQSAMLISSGNAGTPSLAVGVVLLALLAISPPVFLIVATAAPGFGRMLNPAHWAEVFRGRLSHLLMIYVVYLGGLGVVTAAFIPIILGVWMMDPGLGQGASWAFAVFASGLSVDLLGRLCGFFVLPFGTTQPVSAPTERSAPRVVSGRRTQSSGPAPATAPVTASVPAAPAPVELDLSVVEGNLETSKPELANASERINDILENFVADPDRIVIEVEDLEGKYAPHPLVLHALCLIYHKVKRFDDSTRVASDALFVCVSRGETRLAAEIYALHPNLDSARALDRTRLLGFAQTLLEADDPDRAEVIFRRLVDTDPTDRRAVKALMKIAENFLHNGGADPRGAREIYMFLLDRTGSSPLASFMHQGLAEADRRLAG